MVIMFHYLFILNAQGSFNINRKIAKFLLCWVQFLATETARNITESSGTQRSKTRDALGVDFLEKINWTFFCLDIA